MKELVEYLGGKQKGPIIDTTELESILADCWHEFGGSEAEGMAGYKLCGRIEDAYWDPPVLSFIVERHGGFFLGSSRADLQMWELNVDTKTAECRKVGYRQVGPRQPRLDVRPMAEKIVKHIVNHKKDKRLKWSKDGSVRVLTGKILPETSAVKQTLIARRKRFRKKVDELISNVGWQKVRENVYVPLTTH